MHKHKGFKRIFVFLMAILLAVPFPALATRHQNEKLPPKEAKIASSLLQELENNETAEALIYLKNRAVPEALAQRAKDATPNNATTRQQRNVVAESVVQGLRSHSQTQQRSLLQYLEKEKRHGNVLAMESYYIANVIYVKAHRDVLHQIAARSDVEALYPNSEVELTTTISSQSSTLLWNLTAIQVPDVWSSYGVTGEGAVVGVLDSGVHWEHEALASKWRGYNPATPQTPDPIFNWFDAVHGEALPYDITVNSHGTHVTGIVLGATPSNPFGVAPGAQWIAAQAFGADGKASSNHLLAAAQYLLAPTDAFGVSHPDKAPDVINCSWGASLTSDWFKDTVNAWRSAQIVPVFAAGNSGNEAPSGTIANPAHYPESFAVGSVNQNLLRSSTSGEGPGPTPDHIKPDISAPGVSIRSSIKGENNGYDYLSGTSMAAPHVAGVVALMRSANPALTVIEIESVLKETAVPLTDTKYATSPNMGYGYGLLDAYAALERIMTSIDVTGIEFPFTEIELGFPGTSVPLDVRFIPADATDRTLVWQTDAPQIVTVENGQLTPQGLGQAIITAATPDNQFSMQCTVTVVSAIPERTPKVATGYRFSAALLTDGTVWTWGSNSKGQLGYPTDGYRNFPAKVNNLTGVQDIVVGDSHVIALMADGTVQTWGDNQYGQLGTGGTSNRTQPQKISGFQQITAIGAGDEHSLAVKSDGTAWAWGNNEHGQLGDGTKTNRSQPVQVKNLSQVVMMDGGWEHSLALCANGSLWSWGNNDYGQLGDGTQTSRLQPTSINTPHNFQSIATGTYHSLALDDNGTVWTWGDNFLGQLGHNSLHISTTPTPVSLPEPVSTIVGGFIHTLVLTEGNNVYGWGGNDDGQLGDNTTQNRPTPVPIPLNLTNPHTISTGVSHSAAINGDGKVFTWGSNDDGELGDGTYETRLKPQDINLQTIASASAGLSLNKPYIVLSSGGQREQLWVAPNPYNAPRQSILWKTDHTNVATVTNGVITSGSPGVTQLTATTQDGSASTQCTVFVTNGPTDVFHATITSNPTEGGTTTGSGYYLKGSSVTVHATPAHGYYFTAWKEGDQIISTKTTDSFAIHHNRTLTAHFEPTSIRLSGPNRFDTAIATSKDSFPATHSADAVVITRSDQFADALPGGVLAYQQNGPLLLTKTKEIPAPILAEISRVLKNNGTIYILGGSAAVSTAAESQLQSLGTYNVKRISGANRIETAIKIAQEVGPNSGKAIVAYSHNFPDALAISSYAAREGIPILLTRADQLSLETETYLNQHVPSVTVVGGNAAVSHHTYNQIHNIVHGNLIRLGGASRSDTARLIAQEFFPNPQSAAMVYGWDFPDALTGGVNAARINAPILLVNKQQLTDATEQYLINMKNTLNRLIIYGGGGAVSDTIKDQAVQIIE